MYVCIHFFVDYVIPGNGLLKASLSVPTSGKGEMYSGTPTVSDQLSDTMYYNQRANEKDVEVDVTFHDPSCCTFQVWCFSLVWLWTYDMSKVKIQKDIRSYVSSH